MAVEGMNDSRGSGAQVSVSFSASLLGDVTAGSPKDNGVGFGL